MRLQFVTPSITKLSLRPWTTSYIIPDIPWYNNMDSLSARPNTFESVVVGGIQDYLLMTSMLFMVRISNRMIGGKDIMFVNRLTEPFIELSKKLVFVRSPVTQLCIASVIVSTLFYSSCVYGYDIRTCRKGIVK